MHRVAQTDRSGWTLVVLCGVAWLLAAVWLVPDEVHAQAERLHPEHWAHRELEHFESRGFVRLHGVRPYARRDVRRWVEEIAARDDLTRVERQRLVRLRNEFVVGDPPAQMSQRYDTPIFLLHEDAWSVAADVEVKGGGAHGLGTHSGPSGDGTAWSRGRAEIVVRHDDWFAYDTSYLYSLEEEAGQRTEENVVSARERNWRGLTSNYERAYIVLAGERLQVVFGRDWIGWGARRGEELLVSDHGESMDALRAHLQLGRYRLSTVSGLLSSSENRWFGAHRLEIDLGPVLLGLQESVVYASQHVNPTYVFPLAYYYGNQFNESSDDNVFLGLDAKWSSPVGVLSGEFLMDDFIYDGDPAPNKLGLHLGWDRGFAVRGTDMDVRLGYTAIGRWTFTHRNPLNAYISGPGKLDEGEFFLGHELGPDADRFQLELRWNPDVRLDLTLVASRTRRGEGNPNPEAWQTGDAYDVPFPSGDVLRENRVAGTALWRLHRRTELVLLGALSSGDGRSAEIGAELRVDF